LPCIKGVSILSFFPRFILFFEEQLSATVCECNFQEALLNIYMLTYMT